MDPFLTALTLATLATLDLNPRFQTAYPIPGLPPIQVDTRLDGLGVANQVARQQRLQGRMLWVDCTANIERYNTEEKIVSLIAQIAKVGFNTVVLDVKPISGQVIYPSRIAPKLTEWRGRKLPEEFDPVPIFIREARRHGLSILAAFNAFSEGHRDFKVGPGYATPELQTVIYDPEPIVQVLDQQFPVSPTPNRWLDRAGRLVAITEQARLPEPADGLFAVSLNRLGEVMDGFELEGPVKPTMPRGGSFLVADGEGAAWLRAHAWPGRRLAFVSRPQFVPIHERPTLQIPLMMNPHHPQVQERALAILTEFLQAYAVDGVLYDDRLRFSGLNGDFSPQAKAAFEQAVGRKLTWPDDVFRFVYTPKLERGIQAGPLYTQWLAWRAQTMQAFVARAAQTVRSARPGAQFGIYAGSWYGEYPGFGANYAGPGLDAGFWFSTPDYAKTGFAEHLDLFVTGAYYETPTIHEALQRNVPIGYTVEYAGYLSTQVVRDQTWTYAGIMLSQFQHDPEGLKAALQAATAASQGVMVFDLSHNIEPMWPVFEAAFRERRTAPHTVAGLLAEVRRRRAAEDRAGVRRAPLVIVPGLAGTGH